MYRAQSQAQLFRPHTYSIILSIVGSILTQSSECLAPAPFSPLECLDAAQCILIRYGNVVPWSWSLWNDQWLSSSQVVILLVGYTPLLDLSHRLVSDVYVALTL